MSYAHWTLVVVDIALLTLILLDYSLGTGGK